MKTEQKDILIEEETVESNIETTNNVPKSRYELLQELQRLGINVGALGSMSIEALEQFLVGVRSMVTTHPNVSSMVLSRENVAGMSDVSEEMRKKGPSRSRIARGLAAEYRKSGNSGTGAFAEVCHGWTSECKQEILHLQKSMEMIDDTYFEYLNLGHKEFIKKYCENC